MTSFPLTLELLALLLSYPGSGYHAACRTLRNNMSDVGFDGADELQAFAEFVAGKTLDELEEQFTRTFDVNPDCALEIGWHLFGEDYLRGQMLVRMREELRRFGIEESEELPDHITHALRILAVMPRDEGVDFASACVLPALNRMLAAFEGKQSPYESLLRTVQKVVCREFDLPAVTAEETEAQSAGETDPLWRVPVRFPSSGESAMELVPLEMKFGATDRRTADTVLGGEHS